MTEPKTTSHPLPLGEIILKGPLVYHIGESNSKGLMNMRLENAHKRFLCIEIQED